MEPQIKQSEFGRALTAIVDEGPAADLWRGALLNIGADTRCWTSDSDWLAAVAELRPALLVVTVEALGADPGAVLAELRTARPDLEVFLTDEFGGEDANTEAQGVRLLPRPTDPTRARELVEHVLRPTLIRLRVIGSSALIAVDPAMQAVLTIARRAARSTVPVLIEGPSGAGKELVARELHARSPRARGPFRAINAAAVPESLLESELFGHEAGAFTGARRRQLGLFRGAEGGTVFLDEVESMPLSFQSKLLRMLQERRVRPVGGSDELPVDFRLVAATNRSLEELVREGTFREDLYYRLTVVRLRLPALRDRPADIRPLAEHFLASAIAEGMACGPAPTLSEAALERLEAHPWPGNVRELENAIQRAVVVCTSACIEPRNFDLSDSRLTIEAAPQPRTYAEGKQRVIEEFQRSFFEVTLTETGGNISRAAERCGLSRVAFQKIMQKLELDRSDFNGTGAYPS